MFYLSQAHLQRYQKCPPDFQRLYLDQLISPINISQQEKQDWGVKFHLAMQQLHLGLPLDTVTEDPALKASLQTLLTALPELLNPPKKEYSAAEYRQTLALEDFLLTIICDWVQFKPESLNIYDWKTYRQPQKIDYLQHHWQTKLYLFLMAEKTNYAPEKIAMTYWFIAPREDPKSHTFQYNEAWHQRTKTELEKLLHNLSQDLHGYFDHQKNLQHPHQQTCSHCQNFANEGRSPQSLSPEQLQQLLEQAPPIPL